MGNIALSKFIEEYMSDILKKVDVADFNKDDILRIVAYTLKTNKNNIFLNLNNLYIDSCILEVLKENLDKFYIKNIPLQYIIGTQLFYNEEYIVNENVLVPRADTEILVEKAIQYIYVYNLKNMMDLCCGSGCIGISILNNSNIETCTFVDISDKALEITNKNILHNRINKNVITLNSNLFDEVNEKFDIIVSNPPYIPTADIDKLSNIVKNEPHLALDGGIDGLDKYKIIIENASNYLNNNGYLMLEIGYDQLEKIKRLIENSKLEFIESVKDLGNNDRVVICRFHQK